MKKSKLKLGIFVFIIGFIGVLSILTMEIPIPEKAEKIISELFTPWQFKLLSLINPSLMLLLAVSVGTILYDKVNFQLPIIEKLIYKNKTIELQCILKYGIIGGIIGGILITLTVIVFYPILPPEFIELGKEIKPSIAASFLYGGFTEEIIMRFGLMTFFVWLMFKVFKKLNPSIYWIGIIISAIIFGFGHFPIVFAMIGSPSIELLTYVLIGNAVGGIIFGWLYWKKGLESAIIAHVFAHVVMILGESLLNI